MGLVKLVCQGCGANLDVLEEQRIIECGYCGTTNRLQATVAPQPAPPAPAPPPSNYAPQPAVRVPAQTKSSGASKTVLVIVLVAAVLPIVLGGAITFFVFRTVSSTVDKTLEQVAGITGGALGTVLGGGFTWVSERPFLADVNGDGSDDIVALIQPVGGTTVELVALSGSGYTKLWSTSLGDRSDLPQVTLSLVPGHDLALLSLGATIRAHALADGSQRWVANMPDKVEALALSDQGLWVTSKDDSLSLVELGGGKLSEAEDKDAKQAAAAATPLRDDAGYELIPSHRELGLKSKQFDKLRVERAFCPSEALVVKNRREASCTHGDGLAYATRAKGTKVPFLVGYDPADNSERWREQLTAAGSLETVGSGFEQPRAEFVDGDAIVSFAPDKDDGARIRRVDLSTGKTKWETTLDGKMSPHVNGMVIGEGVVLVSYGQAVQVLSLADGRVEATVGGF